MKKIEAIIRKTKFEDVKDALLEADIEWFSYYDVRGIGEIQASPYLPWCHVRHQFHRAHPYLHRGARQECGKDRTSHHQICTNR